jgi:quercetin dioxygenase-like cupin family protein
VRAQSGAYLRQPGSAERRWLGETSTYFLAGGDETHDAFALVDERARRGESVPLHLHKDDMESFYVLEGELTFFLNQEAGVRAKAGAFVHIPGGSVHGFRVESETARYLILTTPQHGRFYRAITMPSRPGGLPPLDSIEEGRLRQACSDFGVELVGPLPDSSSSEG